VAPTSQVCDLQRLRAVSPTFTPVTCHRLAWRSLAFCNACSIGSSPPQVVVASQVPSPHLQRQALPVSESYLAAASSPCVQFSTNFQQTLLTHTHVPFHLPAELDLLGYSPFSCRPSASFPQRGCARLVHPLFVLQMPYPDLQLIGVKNGLRPCIFQQAQRHSLLFPDYRFRARNFMCVQQSWG